MKRAAEPFAIEERASESAFVEKMWTSEPEPAFLSIAASRWQLVVTAQGDGTLHKAEPRRPQLPKDHSDS